MLVFGWMRVWRFEVVESVEDVDVRILNGARLFLRIILLLLYKVRLLVEHGWKKRR